ncbi:MAG: diaminopimelate epimerase [Firmicutes bacterium]|nr:diaminopimelate epimerase [Bacillota bacterium]
MLLPFTKMHGCGNDYIYVNCFERTIDAPEALSVKLSDRHMGVGGDGLVLILPSDIADARMQMFNADGSEAGMCGNAIRCVAKYVYDYGLAKKERLRIDTRSGVKEIDLFLEGSVVTSAKVDMGPAELRPERIPVNLSGESVIAREIEVGGKAYEITCVSMGNPHAVVFRDNVDDLYLRELGPLFERHTLFPDRVNTEFIEVIGENHLKMRVWERGSGETMACGTGTCAAAVAAVLNGYCERQADITVHLRGGDLVIRYTDESVFMTGNCVKVFEGTVEA